MQAGRAAAIHMGGRGGFGNGNLRHYNARHVDVVMKDSDLLGKKSHTVFGFAMTILTGVIIVFIILDAVDLNKTAIQYNELKCENIIPVAPLPVDKTPAEAETTLTETEAGLRGIAATASEGVCKANPSYVVNPQDRARWVVLLFTTRFKLATIVMHFVTVLLTWANHKLIDFYKISMPFTYLAFCVQVGGACFIHSLTYELVVLEGTVSLDYFSAKSNSVRNSAVIHCLLFGLTCFINELIFFKRNAYLNAEPIFFTRPGANYGQVEPQTDSKAESSQDDDKEIKL